MNINFNLKGYVPKSGLIPLNLVAVHNNKRRQFVTGIRLRREEWDPVRQDIIATDPATRAKRVKYLKLSLDVEQAVADVDYRVKSSKVDISEYIPAIERAIGLRPDGENPTYLERHERYMIRCITDGTKGIYRTTMRRIIDFDRNARNLRFEDMTPDWLRSFNDFMKKTSRSQNYRNIHLRNIRAVFNDALEDGVTDYYPFRKFKIKAVPTEHRALTVEQLRQVMCWPCDARTRFHVDVFMLQFYLCGINMVDLYGLKSIDDGRVVYKRAKTGHPFTIKVEPEAAALIEKLKGKKRLIRIADTYADHKSYIKRINQGLKRLGDVGYDIHTGARVILPAFPKLSTYWARHTWATLAAELDIPQEVIAMGLGHADRSVTDIYIKKNPKKVDDANRKIIDWVVYGRRDGVQLVTPMTAEFFGMLPAEFSQFARRIGLDLSK